MSKRQRYIVSYDEPAYPEIMPADDYWPDAEQQGGVTYTFTEAKAKVAEYYQERLDFARVMLAQTRALRRSDIKVRPR
jgi:hypothetical protein